MGSLLSRISSDLLIPLHDLAYLVRSAPYRYKVYEVKKRQVGKMRTIAQPAREVKALQYWVMSKILRRFPVHSSALAYRRGRSIVSNAKPHAKKRFLLKLDFTDFFHSVIAADLVRLLNINCNPEFDAEDMEHLSRILFWRKEKGSDLVLSIGAPSSPLLSNIVMYEFDKRVFEYCRSVDAVYTRYADDLTFSTNKRDTLRAVAAEVVRLCGDLRSPRLRLNHEKTVHASRKSSRRVTGLVLTNEGTVSIGHGRKREIRAAVHHFKLGRLDDTASVSLGGSLAFINSVEPKFIRVLAKKYGKTTIRKLFALNRDGKH